MFLSDHCSGYHFVAEIKSIGYKNPHELLINRMIEDDFQTGIRSNIFNSKLYYVGLAYDEVTNLQVAFFTDVVEEKLDYSLITTVKNLKKVNRPELTEDEDLQIRKDFHRMDNLNRGVLMPQQIYTFMLRVPDMAKKNPIYFNAIKNNINNIHFQQVGMTVDDFVNECKKAIFCLDTNHLKDIFSSLLSDPKNKTLNYESFRKLTKTKGLNMSNKECRKIISKLSDENGNIEFIQFQKIIEFENK